MRGLLCALALVAASVLGHGAAAQDVWVQIEAQPTQTEAEERARAYAGVFANVAGFALPSGWYGIVLGPYTPEEARRQLDTLKSERLIPGDSFIPDPARFRERFWPAGPLAAPEPAAPPPAAAEAAIAPEPPAAPQALPDETPQEARASEAALPLPERERLQRALQWQGFYPGKIDGAIGRGTRQSMADWQAARGYEPTGVLTTAQRAELVAAYEGELAAFGFEALREDEAGIEITLPTRLVAFAGYQPPFVRYEPVDGSGFQVLLISQQGDESALFGLYEIMQTLEIVPMNGARERKATSFVLTGESAELQSYTEARLQGGFIKGFTLAWRPEDAERAARVLDAMKASFRPVGDRALDETLGTPLEGDRADLMTGLEVRRPEVSRSGFYIDPAGSVLTTTEVLRGCDRLTIDGRHEADVALRDDTLGAAVLRPRGALAPRAFAAVRASLPRDGAEVAVGGYPYEDRLNAPVVTFGTLAEQGGLAGEPDLARLSLAARDGDAGGPVLDTSGAVVGLLLPQRREGEVLPDDVRFARSAAALAGGLAAQGITLSPSDRTGSLAAEDIAALAREMTVIVSCWK